MSTTKDSFIDRYEVLDFTVDDDFTEEELKKQAIIETKSISKKICDDKSINISLIALEELEKLGFKNDLSTYILSKLVEDLYHERKAYNSTSYFDLSSFDNEHYKNLYNYFKVGDEQFYRALIAKSIGESSSDMTNINDIAYGVVKKVDKRLINSKIFKLNA